MQRRSVAKGKSPVARGKGRIPEIVGQAGARDRAQRDLLRKRYGSSR